MDEYARAVVLGLLQAVTEFLPISSSAHLALAPRLMGDEADSLTFDVALHLGTLFAVLVYFWRDYLDIGRHALLGLLEHRLAIRRWDERGRLGMYIALATVPAVVVGGLFERTLEDARTPWVIGTMLILFGVLLQLADSRAGSLNRLASITMPHALTVGCAQALALVPGVSRSGATLSAARAMGFDRETAARFSFLLSGPVVLAAATLRLGQAFSGEEPVALGPIAVGALASGVAGLAVIRWLLGYLRRRSVAPFVWDRIGLGAAILAAAAAGVL